MRRAVFLIATSGVAVLAASSAHAATTTGPALAVDARYDKHAISPEIYGMNFADETLAKELAIGTDRWGGNSTSRYNWQTHSQNLANDYFFENIGLAGTADDLPALITHDRRAKINTIVNIPTLGWVSKDAPVGHTSDCSFPTAKYGHQTDKDPYSDCGNGVLPDGSKIQADPNDTSIPTTPSFLGQWITSLVATYGDAAHGGVKHYTLDNEPGLWGDTHADVHPAKETYDELIAKDVPVAQAIKSADPTSTTLGPSGWGFLELLNSETGDESATHGGLTHGEYFLSQMQQASTSGGVRLLDYFDEHYYPQGDGVALSPAGSAKTQALRLRQTRALWDPTYTDESWQNDLGAGPVRMIPRMKEYVNAQFPGTKISLTEYNFGGLESINGALAQADVLGIFAREGVDLAAIWGAPTSKQPGAYAFRMYRNYDGKGSKFGDTWVRATSKDQGTLAVYAATRSDKHLTVMVINKTATPLASTLSVAGNSATKAWHYQYSGAKTSAILSLPKVSVKAGKLTATYPANSITLWVL